MVPVVYFPDLGCRLFCCLFQTWKLLKSIKVEVDDDISEGEDVVNLDPIEEAASYDFDVITDPAYPGQFRVVRPCGIYCVGGDRRVDWGRVFVVQTGAKIEKIVTMTNWDYYEAIDRFQRVLDAMGINEALKRKGAKEGKQ